MLPILFSLITKEAQPTKEARVRACFMDAEVQFELSVLRRTEFFQGRHSCTLKTMISAAEYRTTHKDEAGVVVRT